MALGTATALGLGRFSYGLVLPAMTEQLQWSLTPAGMMDHRKRSRLPRRGDGHHPTGP
ncbi:YbfB/YjiJ family MFS transporter [Micromonospora sp. NPDC000663]|uniref:YbfB/YjiJ family MFS transporter n=1 Tax=Micromonospora sp. NPDC000663 TaxID=3364218 RepID=UPI0036999C07